LSIIDQNGRIFGKVNLIDFVAVLLILSILPMAYFGYKALTRKDARATLWVEVEVKLFNIIPEVVSAIKEGDEECDVGNAVVGKVEKIVSIMPSEVLVDFNGSTVIASKHPSKKDAVLHFRMLCVKRGGVLFHNGTQIKIGNELEISTNLYNVKGIITGFIRR
jgi:hypothetical protein